MRGPSGRVDGPRECKWMVMKVDVHLRPILDFMLTSRPDFALRTVHSLTLTVHINFDLGIPEFICSISSVESPVRSNFFAISNLPSGHSGRLFPPTIRFWPHPSFSLLRQNSKFWNFSEFSSPTFEIIFYNYLSFRSAHIN